MGRQKKTTAKAYPVTITLNALQNIDEITGYIAFIKQQPHNAIKVGDDLFATIDKIAVTPFAYKECEELPTKTKIYRRAVCHSWYIIYRIKPDEIVILGIIHQSRRSSKIKKLQRVK
ncbi:MAG: type II toxin-antitoxin system RelE/ParE family toxin [Bacteroidota bacterium]